MIVPGKVLLDLTSLSKPALRAMSLRFKRKLETIDDIFDKLPEHFYRRYGKVGYKYVGKDGKEHTFIGDVKYLTDEKYKEKVNKRGIISNYWVKARESNTRKVDVYKQMKDVERNANLGHFKKESVSGYLRKLKVASIGTAINYKKIEHSILEHIKSEASDKHIQQAIDEGIRRSVIETNKKELTGKYCAMTTTSAENPDKSHVHMERLKMRCEALMKHLSRPGCQHDFEVIE